MKSEKVWTSLLLPFSLLLFTSAAQAEQVTVPYRDYDAATGTFTNAVRECTLVTDAMRELEDGWYAVTNGVSIKDGLDIKGTVHLVLCDMNEEEEELTVGRPTDNRPGIRTEGATLVIYGQTAGSGKLAAYGGNGATGENNGSAGIGGGPKATGGTVIINGGTVSAEGGVGGAGIGGGGDNDGTGGMGGTVIINGGTVTATGMFYGAGIGGGRQASGGTVTINGGTVTATSKYGAGIGGGSSVSCGDLVSGGTVTINGGTVKASASGLYGSGIGAGGKNGIGAKLTINGGTVTAQGGSQDDGSKFVDIGGYISTTNASPSVMTTVAGGALNASNIVDNVAISGGIFTWKPQDGWIVPDCSVVPNEDEETKVEYPWAIADNRPRVVPGQPLGPFDTAEAATNAMERAAFVPSEAVAAVLGTVAARVRYAGWFGFGVTSKGATEWYVEAALTDAAKAHLAATATAATRQIPVSAIAALTEGTKDVPVEGCEPGFYYTLYGAAGVRALPETWTAYGTNLSGLDGKMIFWSVAKPSDAAGFFTIGVSATRTTTD